MYIDTHSHLYSESFDSDSVEMIQRAINAGVSRMYMPNIDLDSIEGMHFLEQQFPENCFATMGLHPCSVNDNFEAILTKMHAYLLSRKYKAIGEIGMDLYWDKTFIEQQKQAFIQQISWAKEFDLPIIIHCREAFSEIFEVMDAHYSNELSGVFHCFTGSEVDIKKISSSYPTFYFGIGGVITYKKSDLPEILSQIPLEKLVLETDAPYLSPVPFRGKRNESAYIPYIAEKVSEILEIPISEIARITTENALRLYKEN